MAAPQIPNLNTFRGMGGGGRGRGRGRGAFTGEVASSPEDEAALKDKIVQETDLDASISRLSAVELGYLHDPFAHLFVTSEPQRRLPIMNRGTYLRTSAINKLIYSFLQDDPSTRKQIISLGAGTDTRYFNLVFNDSEAGDRSLNLKSNLIYHEYDLPNNIAKKKANLTRPSIMSDIVGAPIPSDNEEGLDFSTYHLHTLDLRSLDVNKPIPSALREIDTTLPTVIISECCLTYLRVQAADNAAKYFTDFLFPKTTSVGMIIYEAISPFDSFGTNMVVNLAARRGIVLETITTYDSLSAQGARLRAYGYEDAAGTDLYRLWEDGVLEKEKARLAEVEIPDEMEEWNLLASHYCLVWGWRGGSVASTWNGWKQMRGKLTLE